ncbi:MAG: hypothetical protein QM723_14860 [Myxococcaceae bacterium]
MPPVPDAGPGPVTDAGTDAGIDAGAPLRILFIGNSYTYVNDLPGMLARIAATAAAPPLIAVDSEVVGGATLRDHWDAGLAEQRILERGWTHVVLQDQSVEPMRAYLDDYDDHPGEDAEVDDAFADLIADAGARPVWYATWARSAADVDGALAAFGVDPSQMQDMLTASYAKAAARKPGGVLVCVGEAFRRTLAQHPELVLHQADGSHPTVAGTYLAASTFYVALTGRPVPDSSEVPDGLDAADAAKLRAVAMVGTDCAGIRVPARMSSGPLGGYWTSGAPVTNYLYLRNLGDQPAGLTAGALPAEFSWPSGAFPGYADPRVFDGYPPCAASLLPNTYCSLAVTYSGAVSTTGTLTLGLTGAYLTELPLVMSGETTDQPQLRIRGDPGAMTYSADDWVSHVSARVGETVRFDLIVSNNGGAAADQIVSLSGVHLPFAWGPSGDPDAGYPGGSGSVQIDGVTYGYCGTQLDVGSECALTGSFAPDAGGNPSGWFRLQFATDAGTNGASKVILGSVSDAGP